MPLISNVEHHESCEMFSLPLSLRSRSKAHSVASRVRIFSRAVAASTSGAPLSRIAQPRLGAQHRGISLQARRQCLVCHQSQSVVGASRRLESQSVGAAEYGSLGPARCLRAGAVGTKKSKPYRLASSVALHRAMPNYSIERTSPGKPGAASHVKR
jgi:hypothetical protein